MTHLNFLNLEPELVESLKKRALKNGRSVDMEYRAILREVFMAIKECFFLFLGTLMSIFEVGDAKDFNRIQSSYSHY